MVLQIIDPRCPGGGLGEVEANKICIEGIVTIANSAQVVVGLLGQTFMEAVELFLLLIQALIAPSTSAKLPAFFLKLINALGSLVSQIAQGLIKMIFEGPFKDVWDVLCGVTKVMRTVAIALVCDAWIPVGIKVGCHEKVSYISCKVNFAVGLTRFKVWTTPPPAMSIQQTPVSIQHVDSCDGLLRATG